ncbi:MAG: hypothetical protein IAE81_08895 [Caldilineaceae bacterium]|nr:hypothetical protein [Caldilineaceae bacterium]
MTTFISIVALVLAAAALGYAWKLNRELDTARERLDRYNRSLFNADEAIRNLRRDLDDTQVQARVEMLRRTGEARFLPGTTVREATLLHPQAQQVLAGFHLGGCNSCAVDGDDTLAALCRDRGVDTAVLLTNLNRLLESAGAPSTHAVTSAPEKTPNIVLHLEM